MCLYTHASAGHTTHPLLLPHRFILLDPTPCRPAMPTNTKHSHAAHSILTHVSHLESTNSVHAIICCHRTCTSHHHTCMLTFVSCVTMSLTQHTHTHTHKHTLSQDVTRFHIKQKKITDTSTAAAAAGEKKKPHRKRGRE